MPTRITAANIDTGAITADKIATGAVTAAKVAAGVGGGPKISSITYPGDDTGVDPAGGQQIAIAGSLFESGCQVYIGSTAASAITVNSASLLTVTLPAKTVGSHVIYVINPDGATAVYAPGVSYSTVPAWSTASGSIGTPYEASSFSVSLSAPSDSAVTYALAAGSSLPNGLSLAANGTLSGTIPVTGSDTTYNFNVIATDAESQSSESRAFSVTYKADVVTWSSPAAGATLSGVIGQAFTQSLSASSAAGRSVSYSLASGSLPTGLSLSGSTISGTPSVASTNTIQVAATSAVTLRSTNRSFTFNIPAQTVDALFFQSGPTTNLGTATYTASNSTPDSVTYSNSYATGSTYGSPGSQLNFSLASVAQTWTPTSNTTWNLDSNWYMDIWVYNATSNAGNPMVLWTVWDAASPNSQLIMFYDWESTSYIKYPNIRTSAGIYAAGGTTSLAKPSLNTWTHYALQYTLSTRDLSCYKDGVRAFSTTVAAGGWGKYGGKITPLNWYNGYAMGGIWYWDNFRIGTGIKFSGASFNLNTLYT